MNKTLRESFLLNSWSELEGFLVYFRKCGAFSHISGNHNGDANPYWWGAIYDYQVGEKILNDIVTKRSLKSSRLHRIIGYAIDDVNSPIVRLTGLHLKRKLDSLKY